jgi:hypothetical protein
MLAPIALFVYDRPQHLRATLVALEKNYLAPQSELFIFADGPKTNNPILLDRIRQVRDLIREKWKFKNIYLDEQDFNIGLAQSIIRGVTRIVHEHGKLIVLEDDLITSKGFLNYMNDSLDKYSNDNSVMQISAFQFPVNFGRKSPECFFLPFTTSWGWATWSRAWDKFDEKATGWEILKIDQELKRKFDMDNSYPYTEMLGLQMEKMTIDSWAIRWWWSVFKNNGLVLFPKTTFVKNNGFDELATHTSKKVFADRGSLNNKINFGYIYSKEINVFNFKQVQNFLSRGKYQKSSKKYSIKILYKKLLCQVKKFYIK